MDLLPWFLALLPLVASVTYSDNDGSIQWFQPDQRETNNFHLLLLEGGTALIGARNTVFNVSLSDMSLLGKIEWVPPPFNIGQCRKRFKTEDECQNYVKVIVRTEANKLLVCGTHAFQPQCRTYNQESTGNYVMESNSQTRGIAKSPPDFRDDNTAIYSDGKLYTATVSDFSARDPLIMEHNSMIRTQEKDSKWLNDPDFVSSFDIDDKIYFFFRESAVEHINCGKAVFSRVARICKSDSGGGTRLLTDTWTSFFKARLNCSIPGDYPFYFDEIQSTSDFGQGKFKPTFSSGDRSDMVYAVFSTPKNSVQASAVCAFRYSDIKRTFRGRFKGQESAEHNWLPVPTDKAPSPHPEQCTNNSRHLKDMTLNFIKAHPLMDEAVPSAAGMPLLMHSSFKSQFTHIAIDWQVLAADNRYYDIMFIGTDDGRLIKAINKAWTHDKPVEPVVIEDIQVFPEGHAVRAVKVVKQPGMERVILVADNQVASLPLHRCDRHRSCRACVKLQDPYCSWTEGRCSNTDRGIMNFHEDELDDVCAGQPEEVPSTSTTTVKTVPTARLTPLPCVCPRVPGGSPSISEPEPDNGIVDNLLPTRRPFATSPDPRIVDGDRHSNDPNLGEARQVYGAGISTEILVISVVASIIFAMLVGFFIGFKVSSCRRDRDNGNPFDGTSTLQKGRNRLSSGEHPPYYQKEPDSPFAHKQFNYVVNVKPGKLNTSVETKPVTKSNNKVYL